VEDDARPMAMLKCKIIVPMRFVLGGSPWTCSHEICVGWVSLGLFSWDLCWVAFLGLG